LIDPGFAWDVNQGLIIRESLIHAIGESAARFRC